MGYGTMDDDEYFAAKSFYEAAIGHPAYFKHPKAFGMVITIGNDAERCGSMRIVGNCLVAQEIS